jgi:hypothetical protein
MSIVNEALQRAANDQKEKKVIPVPRYTGTNLWTPFALAAVFLLCGFLGYRVWAESKARVQSESFLAVQLKDLDQRHADLVSRIYQSDAHLDTRLQLEVFDLKADLRKLNSRMDELDVDQIQSELKILSKRFHNNEREHSILNDRIEALKARLDGAAS